MISKLPYFGLAIYLITGIFYIFPSGMPQPADFFLLVVIAFAAVFWRRVPPAPALYLTLALFCIWIYLVNAAGFAVYDDTAFLKKTAFYIYNALVLTFVLMAAYRDWPTLCAVIRWACIVALFAQLAHVLLVPAYTISGVRAVGTFHNPNQLGYWVLLSMALLATSKDLKPLNAIDLAAIGAGCYAILISLSKAALASGILMLIFLVVFQRVRRVPALVGSVVAISVIAFSQLQPDSMLARIMEWDISTKLEHRVTTEQTDDNILNRGYKVIWENPQYWALGAGEGRYVERFVPSPKNSEIHSTVANVFFSYGLVGLGLFLVILWIVFAKASWASCCYFVPIMTYGVTHMGLRFSEFWIFLALAYGQARWSQSAGASHATSSYHDSVRLLSKRDRSPVVNGDAQRRPGVRYNRSERCRSVPSGPNVPSVSRAGPYWSELRCDRS